MKFFTRKKKSHKFRNTLIFFILLTLGFFSLGPFLSPSSDPVLADAIVVISGGGNERVKQGINLFHGNWAPRLILSGDVFTGRTSNAAMMKMIALKNGVPDSAIIMEPEAETTFDNAIFTRDILQNLNLEHNKIILVTSNYHSRRAQTVFTKALQDSQIQIISIPADSPDWNKWTWWQTERGRYLTLSESAKLLFMFLTGQSSRPSSN